MPQAYKSLTFTIRPRHGVPLDTQLETLIIKYLTKHAGFLCSEKEDEDRHLHGQVFWNTDRGKTSAELKKILLDYTEKALGINLSPDEKIHGFKIKIAYSDEWYSTYCQKEDGMLYTNMPPDTKDYYPTQEEQEKALQKYHAVDKKYYNLQQKWLEQNNNKQPKQLKDISSFIYNSMFVTGTMHVIECPKKRNQLVKCLYEYILKDSSRYILFMHPEDKKQNQEKADLLEKYKDYLKG